MEVTSRRVCCLPTPAPHPSMWIHVVTGPEGGEGQLRTGVGGRGQGEGRWGEPSPEAEMTLRLAVGDPGDTGS